MALLIVERGADKGRKVELKQNRVIVVGRSSEADLVLNDPMASRRHFEVEGRDGKFFIRDASSTNGTYLNGELLTEEKELEIGDKIEVGFTILSFVPHSGWRSKDTVTGQNIAGYLIVERIGRGGMGTVYKALQLSLDRTVALKILSDELCRDTAFIELFVREARNAGQLNHPNIVHVYDVGRFNEIYYLSMEYMANGSVADLLRKERRIRLKHAIPMMIDATRGLEYAEKKGLIHRDIKPDNLLMNDEGVVKIGDLGIAKKIKFGSGVHDEGLFGSPLYMSPEQAKCERIDHRADIYSLGATFYHILGGRPPFEGKTPQEILLKQINEPVPPLKSIAPNIPDEVCRIVEKMLDKDINERYQSARDVLSDLEAFKQEVRIVRRYQAPKTNLRRLLTTVGIGIAIAAALVVSVIMLILYERSQREYNRRYSELSAIIRNAKQAALEGRYESAIKQLDDGIKKYSKYPDLEPLILKVVEMKQKCEEKKNRQERIDMEENSALELKAVEKFYKTHPDAHSEALKLFQHITEKYPGTEAAKKAEKYIEEITRKTEEEKERLKEAQMEAERLIRASRVLAQEGHFVEAFAQLAGFPENYKNTPAYNAIKQYYKRLELMEEQAFQRLVLKVRGLIKRGRFSEAQSLIDNRRQHYTERKKKNFSSLQKEIDDAVAERERQMKEELLKADKKRFLSYFPKVGTSFCEFDFDGAEARLSSLVLLLKTDEYRKATETLKELLALAFRLHNRLIKQINEGRLLRPVRLPVGRIEADVCGADQQHITLRCIQTGVGFEVKRKWESLSVQQLLDVYSAMDLDAEDMLGIGAFLIFRGADGADEWFNRAEEKDIGLRIRTKKFKGLKKYLK